MNDINPISAVNANKREDARVKKTGQFGADKKYVGEGRGAHIDAGSAWDGIDASGNQEWDDAEINVLGIDSITLHRTTVEAEENGTASSLFVQASRFVDFSADIDMCKAFPEAVDRFVRDQYGDAYPVFDGDWENCEIQFACDDDDLDDGQTFPNDVEGLSQFILDKTKIGQLRDDIDSGLFHERLRAHLHETNKAAWAASAPDSDLQPVVQKLSWVPSYPPKAQSTPEVSMLVDDRPTTETQRGAGQLQWEAKQAENRRNNGGGIRYENAKASQQLKALVARKTEELGRPIIEAEREALRTQVREEWPDARHAPSFNFDEERNS